MILAIFTISPGIFTGFFRYSTHSTFVTTLLILVWSILHFKYSGKSLLNKSLRMWSGFLETCTFFVWKPADDFHHLKPTCAWKLHESVTSVTMIQRVILAGSPTLLLEWSILQFTEWWYFTPTRFACIAPLDKPEFFACTSQLETGVILRVNLFTFCVFSMALKPTTT